jgi:hypothetical protein
MGVFGVLVVRIVAAHGSAQVVAEEKEGGAES